MQKTKTECLVIGDLNIDFILNGLDRFPEIDSEILAGNYEMVIGGSGGIFAGVLSMLGIRTAIISKIGNDTLGRFLIDELDKNYAETKMIIIDKSEKTGITLSLSYHNGKSQISSISLTKKLKIENIDFDNLDSIKHVHFPSYYMLELLKPQYVEIIKKIRAKHNGMTFSMDTNDDPADKWDDGIYDIFPYLDILFLNRKEALNITRTYSIEEAIRILGNHVKKIIIKAGIDGYWAKIDNSYYRGYCKNKDNINFIDSTGAGDNFDAAFIYGFIKKLDIKKTLEFANQWAEKSIEYIGGVGICDKFNNMKDNKFFNNLAG